MKFILLFENISQIFSTANRIPRISEFHCDGKTKMYNLHSETEKCSQKNIVGGGGRVVSRPGSTFSSQTQRSHFYEHRIELLLKILIEETIQDGVGTSTQHS